MPTTAPTGLTTTCTTPWGEEGPSVSTLTTPNPPATERQARETFARQYTAPTGLGEQEQMQPSSAANAARRDLNARFGPRKQ